MTTSATRSVALKFFLRYLAQKSGQDSTPRFLVKYFCTRTTIRVQNRKGVWKWSKNRFKKIFFKTKFLIKKISRIQKFLKKFFLQDASWMKVLNIKNALKKIPPGPKIFVPWYMGCILKEENSYELVLLGQFFELFSMVIFV